MPDREKVIKGLRCIKGDLILCVYCAYSDGNGHGTYSCKSFCANDAIDILNEQKAVRCKDCKHFERYYAESKNGVCNKLNIIERSEDWFCADGERKEE